MSTRTEPSHAMKAAIIVGSICTVIITIAAVIVLGMVVQTRYSPDSEEIEAVDRRESRALARDLVRPCAEKP